MLFSLTFFADATLTGALVMKEFMTTKGFFVIGSGCLGGGDCLTDVGVGLGGFLLPDLALLLTTNVGPFPSAMDNKLFNVGSADPLDRLVEAPLGRLVEDPLG